MIVRSRAPLRLGLAGGASDVSPFCDRFGGHVLNATINAYAYCHLVPADTGKVEFIALDRESHVQCDAGGPLPLSEPLLLHKAVHNRIMLEYGGGRSLSLKLSTYSDAPVGSGLGASSTLVVAMLQAYSEWLKLPLGKYDLSRLAFEIERTDAGLLGGRQDQYAAAFGGFNFMEFYAENRVIVNPLRIRQNVACELESHMILYYTGISRESAGLIGDQQRLVEKMDETAIAATIELKNDALAMKEALLKSNIREVARVLGRSWEAKKKLASAITNPAIEEAYEAAMRSGAYSGRISGAGGGGFIIFMADPALRYDVIKVLKACGGQILPFHFSDLGAHAWTINQP
jgi:D-glycero-alpha-D-manno-heptose-7-phosphate kinase